MIFILSVLGVAFAFGLVVFVHEFGHFIVAKKSGIRVEQFSFGFGKEIFGITKGETRYTVNWIPLGGFVKMAGDTPEDYKGPSLEEASAATSAKSTDKSRDFLAQPWYTRIAVALAGPFMNYVLATFLFTLMLVIWGEPVQINKTEIGEVMAGKPAASSGLMAGDHILKVDGETMDDFLTVAQKIHGKPGVETEITIKRNDQEMSFRIVPEKDPTSGIGLIGIRPADPKSDHTRIGVVSSLKKAVWQCWNISRYTVYYLGQKIAAREKPDMAGPIGISQVIVKAVKTGWEDFIYLIGMISVAIGLFNLFPVPMLDGGHVMYYAIEGIRGKPVSTNVMNKANMVGLVFLLSLFVFATYNDLQRIYMGRNKAPTEQTK